MSLAHVANAQEIFLHTLPLGLLIIYNFYSIDKNSDFDYAVIVLTGLSFMQVYIESIAASVSHLNSQ
jgi:hypothetical protein